MLCVKGRFGTGFVHARDRITTADGQARRPLARRSSWDEALDAAADGLARHRGRFGALACAKATNEDGYVIQKLCRVVMGTNNVDHCTRLCHSPSVEAMLVSMGSGATSNSYQDYEEAGCLMIVGADASANHPVIADPLPPRGEPRRAADRHQPQAHRAVRPGRSLDPASGRAPTSRSSTRWRA